MGLRRLLSVFVGSTLLALLLSFLSHYLPGFNDSYFHLAMGRHVLAHGSPTTFPWLWWTTLHEHFVHQHFLFHLCLGLLDHAVQFLGSLLSLPFSAIEFVGAKLWASLMVGGVTTFLLVHIQKDAPKNASLTPWIALLLLLPYDFWVRMLQVRAQSLSLLLMIAALWFYERRHWKLLVLLSFFFPWTYAGFLFLPAIILLYETVKASSTHTMKQWRSWTGSILVISGSLVGLLLHPSSPEIFTFLWMQTVMSGLGVTLLEPVEWFPYSPLVFFALHLVLLPIFILGVCRLWQQRHGLSYRPFAYVLLALFFLLLTIKSQRFIEYWPAFAVLFLGALHRESPLWQERAFPLQQSLLLATGLLIGASWIPNLLTPFPFGSVIVDYRVPLTLVGIPLLFLLGMQRHWRKQALSVAVLSSVWMLSVYNLALTARAISPPEALVADALRIGECLAEKTAPDSLVFLDQWDRFPLLFYANTANYYTLGLDPIFLYALSPDLWEQYRDLPTSQEPGEVLSEQIRKDFRSHLVLIGINHTAFAEKLRRTPGATLICNTRNFVVIDIAPPAPSSTTQGRE